MVDINPYGPTGVGASEMRSARNRSRFMLAFFVCCFLLTIFIPIVEYRQVNYIHHLPLFIAYVGLFFPEYRVFAIFYVAGHLAFCSAVSFAAVQCKRIVKTWFKILEKPSH